MNRDLTWDRYRQNGEWGLHYQASRPFPEAAEVMNQQLGRNWRMGAFERFNRALEQQGLLPHLEIGGPRYRGEFHAPFDQVQHFRHGGHHGWHPHGWQNRHYHSRFHRHPAETEADDRGEGPRRRLRGRVEDDGGDFGEQRDRDGERTARRRSAYSDAHWPDKETLSHSVKTVLDEAKRQGLSPNATRAAVAAMLWESKGNPKAIGDGRTSFGLFQLHRGGELDVGIEQGILRGKQDAFDPEKNAKVALQFFKKLDRGSGDPGRLAARAQRPKDREAYREHVDNMLPLADRLIRENGGLS